MKRFYTIAGISCCLLALASLFLLWKAGGSHSYPLGCILLVIGSVGTGLMLNCFALGQRIDALEKRLEQP